MLDIREIDYWISRYENEAGKLDDCVMLSALYTIRDKMLGGGQNAPWPEMHSQPTAFPAPPEGRSKSEFLRVAAGCPAEEAWTVMDELMETLKAVNPRVYDSVLRKLNAL